MKLESVELCLRAIADLGWRPKHDYECDMPKLVPCHAFAAPIKLTMMRVFHSLVPLVSYLSGYVHASCSAGECDNRFEGVAGAR